MQTTAAATSLVIAFSFGCSDRKEQPAGEPAAAPTKATAPAPKTPATPAAQALAKKTGTPGQFDCGALFPADEVKSVCGVDQPLFASSAEGMTPAAPCFRVTNEKRRTKVNLSLVNYRDEAMARAAAGNPEPLRVHVETKNVPKRKSVSTSARMFKGGVTINALARSFNGEAPLCTAEQLKELAKRVHERLP